MKKIFNLLIINLIILLCCLCISEIIIFNIAQKDYNKWLKNFNTQNPPITYSIKMKSFDETYNNELNKPMSLPSGSHYAKKPIILFGCSYTSGSGLSKEQKLSSKLSKYTKRPVYNRGIAGGGIQHMYYQLSREDFYKQIKEEPEYIIYTYIPAYHTHRMYEYTFHLFSDDLYLRYVPNKLNKDGDLIRTASYMPKYINGLYTTKKLFKVKLYCTLKKDNSYHDQFTYLLFKKSMEKAKQHYKKTNFVILCYEIGHQEPNSCADKKELFSKLKKDGAIVLSTKDLVGRSFDRPEDHISKTDDHPTEKVWDILVPILSKKLKL